MKKFFALMLLIDFIFASTLYVATSANVSYALNDIIKEFNKKYPDIKIKIVISSSGKLTSQIMHNAPYDIFLAANMKYPNELYKKGFAINKPKVYARGEICFFSTKIKNLSFNLLKVREIAIANPKFAPYGKAAIEAFKNKHILNQIRDKLIYAETITSVIPYVINSADVGVIAKSMLYSPKIKNLKTYYFAEINKSLYTPIKQGVVMLNNKKETKEFFEFLFSKEAKDIFRKYGYY